MGKRLLNCTFGIFNTAGTWVVVNNFTKKGLKYPEFFTNLLRYFISFLNLLR